MNIQNKHLVGSTGDPDVDARVWKLVTDWGCDHSPELIVEMIITSLKLAQDQAPVADLKLFNRALKEMRQASRMFEPYCKVRKVAVFGSARTAQDAPEFIAAEEYARQMKDHGYMIITGGGEGIMGAAQRGAGRENSFGLNIRLPFEQRANETIHGDRKLIDFNYFFTRKLNFLKETHAVALFPGGFGTMDKGFETLTLMQTGKSRIMPLVLVDKPGGHYWETWMEFLTEHLLKLGLICKEDFHLFKICKSVEEAVAEVIQFYRLFHSYRWVGNVMVIRITRPLSDTAVCKLNEDFKDLLESGEITQGQGLKEERNETDLISLKRIILRPHRHKLGHIRLLIDAINLSQTE